MPLLKESYFVGEIQNHLKSVFFLGLGILGGIILIYSLIEVSGQFFYMLGSGLLLLTALYYQLTYFIALEIILMAGHGAILLGVGPVFQVSLPVLLSLQLLIYYLLSGELRIFRFIGIAGIALLSIGLSFTHLWIFFFGSLFVGIYSGYTVSRGKKIALVWVILNLIFVLIVLSKVYFVRS